MSTPPLSLHMLQLKVYDGQQRLQKLPLESTVITIGREPGNDLVLADVSVSRRHARVEPRGSFYLLRDNGSTNGTFVNEMLARAQVLSHGDVVRIGKYTIRVETVRAKGQETTKVRVETLRLPGGGPGKGSSVGNIQSGPDRKLAQASRERLLRIHEIQTELGYVDTAEALAERALDLLLREMAADRGSVLLYDPAVHPDPATITAPCPVAVRSDERTEETPGHDSEIHISEDLLRDAIASPPGTIRSMQEGSNPGRSVLLVPLRERGRLRGFVYLERGPSRPTFVEEDLYVTNAISGQIAIGLANAELLDAISLEREKIREILMGLTEGILITDRDGTVLEANTVAAVLLGLEGKPLLGTCFFELIREQQVSPSVEVLKCSPATRVGLFRILRTDEARGSRIVLSGRMLSYPRGDREPKGMLIFLRDRSETYRLEELKGQFIENMAHKFRTPLTVIRGDLPFLQMKLEADSESREVLDELERNTRTVCQLVEQFFDFAEIELESVRNPAAPQRLQLDSVLQALSRLTFPDGLSPRQLRVAPPRPDMPWVLGHRELILKALAQITENALKFAGKQGTVRIEVEEVDGHARIDFLDDGPGIPSAELEAVFYLGHQVDRERTGQVPGAGLGLSIARHIIQQHGGDVEVESPYGHQDRGTRVSVYLPLITERPKLGADSTENSESETCLQKGETR